MIRDLISGGVEGIMDGAGRLIRIFKTDSEKQAQRDHDRAVAVSEQYASEFRYISGRTAFDSLVDGLNRLVRPVIVYGVITLFVMAMTAPIEFQQAMVGLDAIPDELWYIIGGIIGFYFGARELHKHRDTKKTMALSAAAFDERQRRNKELNKLKDTTMTEAAYQAALLDDSKPLPNSVILEWNERNRK